MINRSLTFQVQTQFLNQKEELIRISTGEVEDEKKNFRIDPKIINAIVSEIKIEFELGETKPASQQNFQYLQLLVRALTNAMILESD